MERDTRRHLGGGSGSPTTTGYAGLGLDMVMLYHHCCFGCHGPSGCMLHVAGYQTHTSISICTKHSLQPNGHASDQPPLSLL